MLSELLSGLEGLGIIAFYFAFFWVIGFVLGTIFSFVFSTDCKEANGFLERLETAAGYGVKTGVVFMVLGGIGALMRSGNHRELDFSDKWT